jgi:hypothetical protein
LSEDLDFQDIGYDLFCLATDIRVDECDVIVACDYVPES